MVFAHGGHWLVNLVYVAPVMLVVGWISVQALLDRRRDAAAIHPPKKEDS